MLQYIIKPGLNGVLCAIFESFLRKQRATALAYTQIRGDLFAEVESHNVVVDRVKAARVWRYVSSRVGVATLDAIVAASMCENPKIDTVLYRFMCRVVDEAKRIDSDFSNPDLVDIMLAARCARTDASKVINSARFAPTSSGELIAIIEPRYNVLPLTIELFSQRADMSRCFVVYDSRRGYGMASDGRTVESLSVKLSTTSRSSLM